MFYRIKYALHLWKWVPGMTLVEAFRWPTPTDRDDPLDDAEAELDAMRDSF